MKIKSIFIAIATIMIFNDLYSEYLWPTNTSNSITTLFGERRSRRFHAGIDVRTFGNIGDKIFAVESGYISRVKITSDGYGKALYLKLNDGNTILYAHLDRYNDFIESLIIKYQRENDSSFIDQHFSKDQYKVNQGDIIGYCGDTGSLSGPHLHFEIRDENNNPINPLKKYYTLEDTLKPIAESIAFLPLDKNCYINGKQDYEVIDLKPLKYNDISNVYKYFMQDTVSILGNFGIAIDTYDKINNSPFKFGVYKIEMLIDNKKVYDISFDNYSFNQDHLIYRELDYHLLNKYNKNYHRLFINHNEDLNFISNTSNYGLNLDKKFHNLIINISDNFNNKIQVQGIIKGDIIRSPQATFNEKDLSLELLKTDKNIEFKLSTRYEKSREIPITYSLFDSTIYKFDKPEKPYEVLSYYTKKDGLKSHPIYISLHPYDPFKITGQFQLQHFDNNILINFIENEFSGYNAELLIEYNNKSNKKIEMYRLKKNTLSTRLVNIELLENINKISVKYFSSPEIIYSEPINGAVFYRNKNKKNIFSNYSISVDKSSLYNDTFIWSSMNDKYKIQKKYTIISKAIKISPDNIPFKNKVLLSHPNDKKGAIFQLIKDKWVYIQNSNSKNLNAYITTGGTFAILDENIKPNISNVFPNFNSKYKINDINIISFNLIDNESGVNDQKIEINLNGKKLYYDYIKYRDLVAARVKNELINGKNHLSIKCLDNLGNISQIEGQFTIE